MVDLVAGGSLAAIVFFYLLPENLRHLYPPNPAPILDFSEWDSEGMVDQYSLNDRV